MVPISQSNNFVGWSENVLRSLESTYKVRWLAQYRSGSSLVPSLCGVCHVRMYCSDGASKYNLGAPMRCNAWAYSGVLFRSGVYVLYFSRSEEHTSELQSRENL